MALSQQRAGIAEPLGPWASRPEFAPLGPTLNGTGGPDTLIGTPTGETIRGRGGDDSINGGDGDDRLEGGAGDDIIVDGEGADMVLGGGGDDRLTSTDRAFDDTLDGEGGIDTFDLSAERFAQVIFIDLGGGWGVGADIEPLLNCENAEGSQGEESIFGGSGDNILDGNDGADTINGQGGRDRLDGGNDDDLLQGHTGSDTILGGLGNDRLYAMTEANPQASLEADVLDGGEGNDTIYGSQGADSIRDGIGTDAIFGGVGDDYMYQSGGVRDGDSWDGEGGIDTWDLSEFAAVDAFEIDLSQSRLTFNGYVTALLNIENVIGSRSDDAITGSSLANRLDGGSGVDTVRGGGGDDTVIGGVGADILSGGGGRDSLAGGKGNDYLIVDPGGVSGATETVNGGGGRDIVTFAPYFDGWVIDLAAGQAMHNYGVSTVTLIGVEDVVGTSDTDTLIGTAGANALEGAGSSDRLSGGGGKDSLGGGEGLDTLIGGAGADRFAFRAVNESGVGQANADQILDFSSAEGDRIDLSNLFTGKFDYIGAAGFGGSGQAEVRVQTNANNQLVQLDIDGDGTSDMDIVVKNSGLSGGAADFVL